MADWRILEGDALEHLRTLPDESVHCCVTSPPYWGLRDYGTGQWEGGDPTCDHLGEKLRTSENVNRNWDGDNDLKNEGRRRPFLKACEKCGAVREDQQLGLEERPQEFVASMVVVFREVRRVLRSDGTCWLNLGDSYARGKAGRSDEDEASLRRRNQVWGTARAGKDGDRGDRSGEERSVPAGLKPKDMVGIPWRVAFALQDDGWYLRSDIIWAKKNSMPESVTDRPTKSHEYIFLLAKSEHYFYDAEAIKEPISPKTLTVNTTPRKGTGTESTGEKLNLWMEQNGGRYHPTARNKRTVWHVATQPFPEAHFATFPTKLIEPCILAGTSERGCCPSCGAPSARILERESVAPKDYEGKHLATAPQASGRRMLANVRARREAGGDHDNPFPVPRTVGWKPTCSCPAHQPVPCTVLDPFSGAGTTGVVALRHGRSYVGIELNPEYAAMSRRRIQGDMPLFNTVSG